MRNITTALILKYKYQLILCAIFIVHLSNLFIDVMEIDAAQYAGISLDMFKSGSYLQVYLNGLDYLDKPPLLFWSSCVSFFVFGVSNFSYKFIPFLTLMLGVYATYRFAKLWYSQRAAIFSAIILASSQAFYLMSNDVRTDGLLTGWVIVSVWLITEYLKKKTWRYLIFAAIATGLAMLAKGPIGLVAVGVAIGCDLVLKRQWKEITRPVWVLYLVIIALVLLPMCVGLYEQYDMHPEKVVYGLKGPSGLLFFFWTQSFGRITGDIYWDNGAPLLYFIQTILWDFQPWVLIFFIAIILSLYNLVISKFTLNRPEYATIGGFLLVFAILSLSHYKLPHYIFLIFPFAAIITADFLDRIDGVLLRTISRIQMGLILLFFIAVVIGFVFVFPPHFILVPLLCGALFLVVCIIFLRFYGVEKLVFSTAIMAVSFNAMMSLNFYPQLLKYQASSAAGKWIQRNNQPKHPVFFYNTVGFALDFYQNEHATPLIIEQLDTISSGSWIYTNQEGKDALMQQTNRIFVVMETPSFSVTLLNANFINKYTRPASVKKCYVLEFR